MWIEAWCALAGGLGRVLEDGSAVVCVRPPHHHQMLRYLGVAGVAFAVLVAVVVVPSILLSTYAVASWAWVGLAAGVLVVLAGASIVAVIRQVRINWPMRASGSQLRAVRPPAGWYVYNLVGDPDRPGRARVLLERECAGADRHRRVLYLDTIGRRPPEGRSLVPYYSEFGFKVVGDIDVELNGENLVQFLMVRHPVPDGAP
jgi:hypothetical protein